MGSLIMFALAFVVGGTFSVRALLRDGVGPEAGRVRRRVQGPARTVVMFALAAQFLLVAFDVQSVVATLAVPLLLGLGVMTWLIGEEIGRFITHHGGKTFFSTLCSVSRERFSTWTERLQRTAAVIIARDWSEIDL